MLRRRLQMAGTGGGVPEWRQHLQPCEYLETDGNCHIIINSNINEITDIHLKGKSINSSSSYIFGANKKNSANNDITVGIFTLYSVYRLVPYTLKGFAEVVNVSVGNFDINWSIVDKSITINNITKTYTRGKDDLNCDFALFGKINHNDNTINYAPSGTQIQIFETNLFNLLSVYVIDEYTDNKGNSCSSGVAGMVDTLTGVFYTNDGSGNFMHGADIEIEF